MNRDVLCDAVAVRGFIAVVVASLISVGIVIGAGATPNNAQLDLAGLPAPVCSTAVARAPTLHYETRFVSALGEPFGVAASHNGRFAFVAGEFLQVYSLALATPAFVREDSFGDESFSGLALSPNGRYLIAASGIGVTVFDVAQLEHGGAGPTSGLVGTLVGDGQSSIEAAFSPDGRYVFVTFEDKDDLQVFNFADAVAHNFSSASYLVGSVPLGVAPVGVAVSPDGRYLYATSEEGNGSQADGTLTTIDLAEAERSPSHAIVSTVSSGCSPVRVVATSQSVYVTARASDELLEFSASKLVSDPDGALEDRVKVGEAPVGLALADKDTMIVVGDSDRFDVPGTTANLAVVKIADDGALRLAGYLKSPRWSGLFPRDMTATPDGNTVLISNFDSDQLEAVKVAEAQ